MHLRCKGGQVLTIISVYRVNPFNAKGDNTVYQQQQSDYLKKIKRVVDPQDQICKNLEKFLIKLHEAKHKIILSADANDDVSREGEGMWNSMLARNGMRNAHVALHKNQQLPRTYNKGSRCIDIIVVSDNIPNDAIQRAGILPFYTINATDHRPLYIDLDKSIIFDNTKPDLTKSTYRRFTTSNIKKCNIYLKNLDRMFEENRIYRKVEQL